MRPQTLLAAAAIGSGRQAQPGGKLPARRELMRIGDRRGQGRCRDDPNAWNALETLHHRVGLRPAHKILLEIPDPRLQIAQLLRQGDDDLGRQSRKVQRLSIEQPRHKVEYMVNAFGHHNAELGQLATDHVDQLRALADQQITRPVHRQ